MLPIPAYSHAPATTAVHTTAVRGRRVAATVYRASSGGIELTTGQYPQAMNRTHNALPAANTATGAMWRATMTRPTRAVRAAPGPSMDRHPAGGCSCPSNSPAPM
ncbi:hypothetical protein Snoj_19880 [Streptomyces nojiriensis]|uniref:Uncharacterized protein n=2 Tax=Streptomyces nojiriensis TaxID=66374 RepID=A0ABQ3SJP0_9ACTN|nr:hypothetical protein GCM10010205_62170 [Streptomyces nojiriensis]GHI68070.1 hypothetical protein Snoj_19880 [Streptomyces nojiriensis]